MAHFIRYGAWCSKCRASLNYAGAKGEKGLSVYDCDAADAGTWKVTGDAWKNNGKDLTGAPGPWSLVEGTPIDTGADGEPVLGDFAFRKALARDDAGSDIFHEIDGGAPQPDDHKNNCTPPSIGDLFQAIENEHRNFLRRSTRPRRKPTRCSPS